MALDTSIQQMIDSQEGRFITLPQGEFEGPFVVKRPCNLIGNGTTLWAKKGPVLQIACKETALRDLRIEVLEEGESLCCEFPDTRFENVEVFGRTRGIPSNDEGWDLPCVLELGEFEAQKECSFVVEVTVPVETVIRCNITGISFYPEKLSTGKNRITIKTEKIKSNITIYGEILFCAAVNRRCYISGIAKDIGTEDKENKVIWSSSIQRKADISLEGIKSDFIEHEVSWDTDAYALLKGQRIACGAIEKGKITVEMDFQKKPREMEIDPYVFLLDKQNQAEKDENIIFFGNTVSADGAVQVEDTKVFLELEKVSEQTERVSISYAIYEEDVQGKFSSVHGFTIKVKSEGKDVFVFQPEDLHVESTVIAVEFYRYKGAWKITAIGAGYKDGLRRLCESYGLEVLEEE